MSSIQGFSQVQIPESKVNIQTKKNIEKTENKTKISSDQLNVSVKNGLVPTLKGAGAGAVISGGAATAIALIATEGDLVGTSGQFSMNLSIPFIIGSAIGGAVGGGISANTTTSKVKGALIGGAGGAVTGALVAGIMSGDIRATLFGAAWGAVSGAAGGFTGSLLAKTK